MDPTERFLRACRRQPVDRPPIWIMRQAGRFMASYQAVRQRVSFMELCRSPELCTEVTLMPVDQLGVDAAILFSDILVPLEGMGLDVSFDDHGPKVAPPLRTAAQVAGLRVDGADEEVAYVYAAVRQIKSALSGRVPLLGFAGAPLTLAIYAIEGGSSRNHHALRKLIYEAPEVLDQLLDKLTTVVTRYLRHQIAAGVDAVQIFDTWGGTMSLADWRRFSLPYTARIMEGIKDTGVPIIHYALGSAHLTEGLAELPCDVLSVDWREPLSLIRERTGDRFALQGNVEPGVLTCGIEHIRAAAKACLDDYGDAPGHIFNLGHGITPDVTVESAKALVDAAKEFGTRR